MQQYQPPNNQPTVPHQVTQPPTKKHTLPSQPQHPVGYTPPGQNTPQRGEPTNKTRSSGLKLLAMAAFMGLFVTVIGVVAVGVGMFVLYGNDAILPNVEAGGVDVGGLSEADAAQKIESQWLNDGIVLTDGERSWMISPQEMGITIDATGTAKAAYAWGRDNGGITNGIQAIMGEASIEPRLSIDLTIAANQLDSIRDVVEIPAKNAGVQLVNGQVQPVPPVEGRVIDIDTILEKLRIDAAGELADGTLTIEMIGVAPAVTDASPLLAEAQQLLSNSLNIEAYDPIRDEAFNWSVTPTEWGQWLIASSDSNTTGLTLTLDTASLRTYLEQQAAALDANRYIDIDGSLEKINTALQEKQFNTWIQVKHNPTTYTVQGGETISSIGYDTGIPYPWIQAVNPGVDALSAGQVINLPSLDDLLPIPVVRNKRIVVSISEQAMWAYENGDLKWNWVVSTGITRSPTSPGIFQIRSHEINAFGGQWNLYMPHFMGVYEPGPNAGVMNGFHGFPTDASGGYLLWTNSLGSPATYGCILLSLENAETLYNWAEEGVVVEIRR